MTNSEYLISLAIASAIIVFFVCCFIKRPPVRFIAGLVLWVGAAFGLLVAQDRFNKADSAAANEGEHAATLNRMRQIEGQAPVPVVVTPVQRATPLPRIVAKPAAPSLAEIEARYGTKPPAR